jgi:hypothetical protein
MTTTDPAAATPEPGECRISWDWREQPDLAELTVALARLGVSCREIETGSDQYEIALSPLPADGARDTYTAAEGARIMADVQAHPRRDVIDAIAEATYDLANDEAPAGGGMWWHLSQAHALVEALPALSLDEDSLCDEPGCGAHPAGATCQPSANSDQTGSTDRPDLDAIEREWLRSCAICDAGLPAACTCPAGDAREQIRVLLAYARRLETERERVGREAIREHNRALYAEAGRNAAGRELAEVAMERDRLRAELSRLHDDRRDEVATLRHDLEQCQTAVDVADAAGTGLLREHDVLLAERDRLRGELERAAGGDLPGAPARPAKPTSAAPVDLMAALRASVEQARAARNDQEVPTDDR